ncbi:LptA/OstA family protein [Bosea sp. (in: a-proteobacteria)]|uniref:LptA/OstA family protein n=1 Tax=Bosea sp. (in: a-proteobacteria) TaxID=1871050 RepID=UPI00261FF010|nr:LptA/OstA family protein [Bosea sp. (in: a-proteobacteria)]MCO5091627.1 organic solvent tolerance protein OstA [Bosea sp. (in: a-proteobacteria)]
MTMAGRMPRFVPVRGAALIVAAGLMLLGAPQEAFAQAGQGKARGAGTSSALGGLGGDSKEPIKIDADKLDVLDKENKAIFSGNVVAVQGETTVRCTVMTVLYEGRGAQGAAATARPAAPAAAGQGNDSSIKRILCKGPVTVVSKTQAATSDNAEFDRANNLVIMTGNVALNDGPNITRGEKLVYNTVTGVANVENKGGRVQGFFVPNSGEAGKADAGKNEAGKPGARPAPKPTN